MKNDYRGEMKFAEAACREAGAITLQYFQKNISVEMKSDASPVTIADRKSEEHLRKRIEISFPGDAIMGEEFGGTASGDRIWFIDPIDGTAAYVRGVPIYGVMLGLKADEDYAVGCVYLPALNEMIVAAKGAGCFWNGEPASVSNTAQLRNALFCHSGLEYFQKEKREQAYREIEAQTALQRTWGDCYGHILVATGRADLCVDPILHPWDAAPLIPIARESGGTFTDWQGKVTADSAEGMSTNRKLLTEILKITARFPRAALL